MLIEDISPYRFLAVALRGMKLKDGALCVSMQIREPLIPTGPLAFSHPHSLFMFVVLLSLFDTHFFASWFSCPEFSLL